MKLRPATPAGARQQTRVWTTRVLAALVVASLTTGACSKEQSPTAPTAPTTDPPAAAPPPPPPAETSATLKGRVTEAVPTSVMGVFDAIVTVTDGTDWWSSNRTYGGAGQGQYSIAALRPGRYNATVAATGFVSAARTITIPADAATDFLLLPVPQTITDSFEDQVTDTDGTCSDGQQARPCRIAAIPVHNAGPIDAVLSWKSATPVALNVTLFQKGQTEPLARSTATRETTQQLAMNIPGGAVYELRITFASGTGPASYTLRVVHPN
jgi:hypothetical protein